MRGREPGEPDGKKVFADAERPIGKRFGNGVDGGARAGFGAMRGEGDAAGEERGGPTPFCAEARGDAERENGSGGRANESVEKIPNGVEVRNFVGEKFENVKSDCEAENDGMGENVEFVGEMDDMEAFEEAESGDGGVKIEAGRETGAEGEADGLKRIHRGLVFSLTAAESPHKGIADRKTKSRFRTQQKRWVRNDNCAASDDDELCEADGEGGDGGRREHVADGGVADGDPGGLGDDDIAMVEGVVRVDFGMSEDGGGGGGGRNSADDNFGFAGLGDVGIDDGEVKVFPF